MRKQIFLMDNARKKSPRAMQRERLLVRDALKRVKGVRRHFENVVIWNPNGSNQKGEIVGRHQWIDFIVRTTAGVTFGILFSPNWGNSGPHKFQRAWMAEKVAYLKSRNISCLVLGRQDSLMEMTAKIQVWILRTRHS